MRSGRFARRATALVVVAVLAVAAVATGLPVVEGLTSDDVSDPTFGSAAGVLDWPESPGSAIVDAPEGSPAPEEQLVEAGSTIEVADEAPAQPAPPGIDDLVPGEEVVALRTVDSKTFVTDDEGIFETVMSTEHVHFRDESGAWQEIDTSLVASPDGERLVTAGSANPTVVDKGGRGDWVTVQLGGGGSVGFSLEGRNSGARPVPAAREDVAALTAGGPAAAAAAEHPTAVREDQGAGRVGGRDSAMADPGATPGERLDREPPASEFSAVVYRDALPTVDVVIESVPRGAKELLVLRDESAPREYRYRLALEGVTPEVVDDGLRVLLSDKDGAVRAEIPTGWMVDSSGDGRTLPSFISGVRYAIEQSGDGEAVLVLTLEEKWLADPDRVYPVVVDPFLVDPWFPVADTFVHNSTPTADTWQQAQAAAGYPFVSVGVAPSTGRATRTMLKFGMARTRGRRSSRRHCMCRRTTAAAITAPAR